MSNQPEGLSRGHISEKFGFSIHYKTLQRRLGALVLKELFELILQKAKKIEDPFEQSFFLLVHLFYLQAYEDVNKRTSRLNCNIPFIISNLCPLSFTDVSRDDYTAGLLAIYEKNDTEPMLELFAWAYSRSCKHYSVVKKSLGEIDAFRIQYRQQRKAVMGQIVKQTKLAWYGSRRIDRKLLPGTKDKRY